MPNHLLEHLPEAQRTTVPYYRRTGKSTAIALAALAQAIQNPGKPITIVDHHFGWKGEGHLKANHHLGMMVRDYAELLCLKFITVKRTDKGITVQSDHIT